jgi:hypothetical protein
MGMGAPELEAACFEDESPVVGFVDATDEVRRLMGVDSSETVRVHGQCVLKNLSFHRFSDDLCYVLGTEGRSSYMQMVGLVDGNLIWSRCLLPRRFEEGKHAIRGFAALLMNPVREAANDDTYASPTRDVYVPPKIKKFPLPTSPPHDSRPSLIIPPNRISNVRGYTENQGPFAAIFGDDLYNKVNFYKDRVLRILGLK